MAAMQARERAQSAEVQATVDRMLALQAEPSELQTRERAQAQEVQTKVDLMLTALARAAGGDLTGTVSVSGDDAVTLGCVTTNAPEGGSLKERLQQDLTAAMRARDEVSLSALRQALSSISVAETAGTEVTVLDDEAVLAVLAVEVRKHHEAADAFEVAGRPERVARERAEAAALEQHLPPALSDDDLAQLIAAEVAAAAQSGTSGMKAMGRVVSAVRSKAGPAADGARIAALVKASLSA